MKKILVVMLVVVAAFAFAGCSKKADSKAATVTPITESDALATVGSLPVTLGDLEKVVAKQPKEVQMQIYKLRKRLLDEAVDDKLIEEAAKKKGMSAEKFEKEEIDSKVKAPTTDEVKSVYDVNKERIGKSFDEAKKEIESSLLGNRKAQAKDTLVASLKKDSPVKIKMEPPRVEVDVKGLPSQGNKSAKVTFVEFSDYQCPFCKKIRPTVWRLVDEYKDKIFYAFGDYPLPFHKDAKKASEAARCAGDQKKYFEYNRKLFDNQTAIGVEDLKKYAKELNLDTAKFDKCLADGKHAKDIEETIKKASAIGVTGTPAYFINGIMLSGAMPYESFKEIIDSELER